MDLPGTRSSWLYGCGIVAAIAFFAVIYRMSQWIGMLTFPSGGALGSSFWPFTDPGSIGPAVAAALLIISLCVAAVMLFSLLALLRGSHFAMPVIFLESALLCGISEQLTLLFMLDIPADYFYSNEVIVQHVAIGFAIAAGLFIYLKIKARRSNNDSADEKRRPGAVYTLHRLAQ